MIHRSNHHLYEIDLRLKKLEGEVFGKKEKTTTNQQMLLLKYTGLLDFITQLGTANENKCKLLSKILNRDKDSVKKAYRQISGSDEDIFTPTNLQFAIETLENLGLNKLTVEPRKKLKTSGANWANPE